MIFTKAFVPGATVEEVLYNTDVYNGLYAYNYLGEHSYTVLDCIDTSMVYDALSKRLRAYPQHHISIKMSQLGFQTDLIQGILVQALDAHLTVFFDMESSQYTDIILNNSIELFQKYGNVGITLQSKLKRTRADMEKICELNMPVRLCKGAYKERKEISYYGNDDIRKHFFDNIKFSLSNNKGLTAIATHDKSLIGSVCNFVNFRTNYFHYEFQMLYGIRPDIYKWLISEKKERVRLYTPFGDNVWPYFWRRIRENPKNLLLAARSMIGV